MAKKLVVVAKVANKEVTVNRSVLALKEKEASEEKPPEPSEYCTKPEAPLLTPLSVPQIRLPEESVWRRAEVAEQSKVEIVRP